MWLRLLPAMVEGQELTTTSVIMVEGDYNVRIPGYEFWWGVPIAKVSEVESVNAAYAKYAEAEKREKYFLQGPDHRD